MVFNANSPIENEIYIANISSNSSPIEGQSMQASAVERSLMHQSRRTTSKYRQQHVTVLFYLGSKSYRHLSLMTAILHDKSRRYAPWSPLDLSSSKNAPVNQIEEILIA